MSVFSHRVIEVFTLLGCYASLIDSEVPTLRGCLWVPSWRVSQSALEDWADRLLRNFGNYQPTSRKNKGLNKECFWKAYGVALPLL